MVWTATTQTVSNSSVTETHSQKQVAHMTTQKKRGRPRKVDTSDGSTASYYELPKGAKELQDLISHKDMNAQIGEIFRSCYRYGQASHSDQLRDAKKIRFYIDAEIKRLGG